MRNKKRALSIVANTIAILVTLIMLIPLLLILINSFKDKLSANAMSMALPTEWHFENYLTVIKKGNLVTNFLNSMLYSVGSTTLCVIFCSMAAYVFSRNRSPVNKFLYFFIVLGIAMPVNFVALTKIMQLTHLNNTRLGIILLYAATQTPFLLFLIYGFISRIPVDLDEAGMIDGCGPLRLFFSVVFPLLKPILVTAVVLAFLNTWNEFLMPLYFLNSAAKWPMTLAVYNFFGMYAADWNLVCADVVLTALPVVVVYVLGQKYIVEGMTAGAVKG